MKSRITFRIKTEYYFELLTPETTKFIRSTKIKITEDRNGKKQPHLEIDKVVLIQCNIFNYDYQLD